MSILEFKQRTELNPAVADKSPMRNGDKEPRPRGVLTPHLCPSPTQLMTFFTSKRQEDFAADDLFTATSNMSTGFHGKYPESPLNLPSTDSFGDDLGLQQHHLSMFDPSTSVSSTASVFPSSSEFPSFNATMRYDHHPPPSSFHSFTSNGNRHTTPSPVRTGLGSRSRSRSRPPGLASSSSNSSSNPSNGATAGSIGPARTSRTRRNSSISGTSPPPPFTHGHPRPHAIVIPPTARPGPSGPNWFVHGQSS